MTVTVSATPSLDVSIRPLAERDLDAADHILRQAFDTFVGVPDLFGDRDLVRTRYRADPSGAIGALLDGTLVGSVFVAQRGSLGILGPLTVRPDLWDRGIAKTLMGAALDVCDRRGNSHVGLFTFAHSPKHLDLYQSFGFWPRFLTALMAKPVAAADRPSGCAQMPRLSPGDQEPALKECAAIANEVAEGLDLRNEIRSVAAQSLGDTVLIDDGNRAIGFGVCHMGPGSEAGGGACYVKFGVVRPEAGEAGFDRLLAACEALAIDAGVDRLEAGVNTGRRHAYQRMLRRGFRTGMPGLTMDRPDHAGYNVPGVYLIDDWR